MRIFVNSVFIFLSAFYFHCSDNPLSKNGASSFEIYFLEDNDIKVDEVIDKKLSQLELESTPWLANKDIEFYDFSSHCIYLKKDRSHFFENIDKIVLFSSDMHDKPFVVVANKNRCYLGSFHSGVS